MQLVIIMITIMITWLLENLITITITQLLENTITITILSIIDYNRLWLRL